MRRLVKGLLVASTLLLVAASPADFAREAKMKTRNIQDDLKELDVMTREVINLSREVEDAADRIKGPRDVQDIQIVETRMDQLKQRTRAAVGKADRVAKLAKGLHEASQDLVEAKGGAPGGQARPRDKR